MNSEKRTPEKIIFKDRNIKSIVIIVISIAFSIFYFFLFRKESSMPLVLYITFLHSVLFLAIVEGDAYTNLYRYYKDECEFYKKQYNKYRDN